jgi:hypothetical protein
MAGLQYRTGSSMDSAARRRAGSGFEQTAFLTVRVPKRFLSVAQ